MGTSLQMLSISCCGVQAMHHYGQSLDVLFYEVLDMPLREYEQLKHMKVRCTLDYCDTVFTHNALACLVSFHVISCSSLV